MTCNRVHPDRLNHGEWKSGKCIGEGDVIGSYQPTVSAKENHKGAVSIAGASGLRSASPALPSRIQASQRSRHTASFPGNVPRSGDHVWRESL